MMQRWNGNGSRFHASEKVFHGSQGRAAKLAGYGLGLRWVAIHHGSQFYAGALLLQLMVNASMVSAERAHTNDRHPNWTFVSQQLIFSDVSQSGKGYHEAFGGILEWDAPLGF
jgi:hypothetical protein